MQLAISLFFIGAGVIALASIIDSVSRVPRLLCQLEKDRARLANKTDYAGPIVNRHGREVKP